MLAYTARRLAGALPTLLIRDRRHLLHGASWRRAAPSTARQRPAAGSRPTCARAYHLDEPLYQQFGRYLWGPLPRRFRAVVPVPGPHRHRADRQRLSRSRSELGGFAMLLALFGGVALGSIAALRQNRPTDYATMAVAMTGISVPNFVRRATAGAGLRRLLGWLPGGRPG